MLWEESVFFRHREDDSKNFRKILKVFRLEGCPEWEKAAAAFLPPGVQAGHCRGKRRRLTLVTGLNEAVRLSPALFKAIYNRGKNRLALDNIEGALGDFDRAVSLKPEHPKAHEYFGDALMRVGKEEEAALQWAIAERLREKKSKN